MQPEGWRQLPRAVMARRGWGMVWVAVAKVRLIHAACAHWSAALSVQLLENGGSQIAVAPSPYFACTRRRGRRRQGDFVDMQVRTSTWRRLVGAASDPLQNWSIIGWAI